MKRLRILWFVCISVVFIHASLPNFANLRVETNVNTMRTEMHTSSSNSQSSKKKVNQNNINFFKNNMPKTSIKTNQRSIRGDVQIMSMVWHPFKNNVFVGGGDGSLKEWNINSKQCIKTFKSKNKNGINSAIAISKDGSILASGASYQSLEVRNALSGILLNKYSKAGNILTNHIKSIALSPNNKKVAAISFYNPYHENGALWTFDIENGTITTLLKKDKSGYHVTYSPDGNILASVHSSQINLFNAKTGNLIRKMKAKSTSLSATIDFSRNGKLLVYSDAGDIIVRRVEDGKVLKKIHTSARVGQVCFSPDTKIIAAVVFGDLYLYSVETGDELVNTRVTTDFIAFSPNGRKLAIARKTSSVVLVWDISFYSETLATLVYNELDKSDYIALYEFTKKFSKHFEPVKKAKVAINQAVLKENTIEGYVWALNHIEQDKQALRDQYTRKQKELILEYEQSEYKIIDKKNNIFAYKWFIDNMDEDKKDIDDAHKKIYEIIKNKNLLAGYSWLYEKYKHTDIGRKSEKDILDMLYATVKEINTVEAYLWYTKQNINLSDHMQEAVKTIYTLEYAKAKKIDTIAGYNDFIRTYPLSAQAQEATKKAYELQKDKYTEIGVLGFIGKDEKMNKQARKLLIEIKKYIENTNSKIDKYESNIQIGNYGHYMIIARMYDLARIEFGDTDAVLSLMESKNIDKYIETIKRRHTLLDYHLQDSDKDEYKRDYWRVVLQNIYYKYNTTDIGQIIHEKYKNDKKEFETFSNEEHHSILSYLESVKKKEKEKTIKTAKKIEDKITRFEEIYQKIVDEYKIESLKVKSYKGNNTQIQDTQLENHNTITIEAIDSHQKTKDNKIMFSNSALKVLITQKEIGQYVKFVIKATNQGVDAKGGVSLSFPALDNKSLIEKIANDGFSTVDVYPIGSKIWNGKLKKQIISETLLLEGWNKVWKSGETKIMSFSIKKSIVNHTELKARGIMVQGKKEILLPATGANDQQGYPIKSFIIGETNASGNSNVSTSQEDIIKSKSMHQLRLNEHLTLEKNSLLYFVVPKYMKPKYIAKENKYLQLRILGCNKEKGSCTGEYRTKKFIMYCDIYANKKFKRKDNLAINISLSIEETKNDKTYNYDGLYYPAITKENIIKTKLPVSFAGKVFSFGSGDSRMPSTLFFDVNESKLKKLIINKKDAGNPPYFIEGTKCVDHDDTRNGEWLSEMYRRGGVLDNNGCLLKSKRKHSTNKTNSKNTKYATVYGLDPRGDGFLAFRAKPKGREIGRFYNGDKVEILAKKGKYYKVRDVRSGKIGWSHGKWIRLGRNTLDKLTKKEKIFLLHQILKQPNNHMKDIKSSIKEYLSHKNKKYTTYKHVCKPLKTNYFKCKFSELYDNGEDEGLIEVEYEAVKNTNNVEIRKIYPVFMAD